MSKFDEIISRRNTASLKWDIHEDELPMWVADMDFANARCILEAIQKRMKTPVFGYNIIPDEWYKAYQNWWKKRHGFEIEKDWLMFSTGVVPTISAMVQRLTRPGENIVIQTPVYNIFFNSILNNGRNALENKLIYEGNSYVIDFEDLEKKLKNPQTSMMILCNPHNPTGNIWSKEELEKIGRLCHKYHVIVLSDEIHCDITRIGSSYIPFASVNEINKKISLTCIAPTKAFNIAGLQTSAVFAADPFLRHQVFRGINNNEIAEPNTFAVPAAVAAFNKGEGWLDQMRAYVFNNRDFAMEYIEKNIPALKPLPANATYLMWIDCSKVCENADYFTEYLQKEAKLFVSEGSQFGKGGKSFIRLNLACPKPLLLEGLEKLKEGTETFQKDIFEQL